MFNPSSTQTHASTPRARARFAPFKGKYFLSQPPWGQKKGRFVRDDFVCHPWLEEKQKQDHATMAIAVWSHRSCSLMCFSQSKRARLNGVALINQGALSCPLPLPMLKPVNRFSILVGLQLFFASRGFELDCVCLWPNTVRCVMAASLSNCIWPLNDSHTLA